MESVKDERMKALWRPFCAGEVRRDKPGGHHHQHRCCQRCSCFLSCRASALSPASPSPRARAGTGSGGEEAKILLSARTGRGAGDGPRSADRSMGPGFHYVNWLLGQQRGRAGGGGGGGGGEEVKEEEEQSFMIDSSSSPIRALDWHHAILSVGTHDNSPQQDTSGTL